MKREELEIALEHYKQRRRILIDNFGFEKHPEQIATVEMVIEFIEKALPKEPKLEGVSDWSCPTCRAWIKFDSLNMPKKSAPKRCEECGQVFDWKG